VHFDLDHFPVAVPIDSIRVKSAPRARCPGVIVVGEIYGFFNEGFDTTDLVRARAKLKYA
jgi:hypothetical protein